MEAFREAIDKGEGYGNINAARSRSNCGEERFAKKGTASLQAKRPRKGVCGPSAMR